MTGAEPIGPPATDPIEDWWDATREHRLVMQCCTACHALQHPPRSICLRCMGETLSWQTMSGSGTVDSWTTVHRSPLPGFEPPYVVARIRLAEGPILLSNLVGPSGHRCGETVSLVWQPLPDGRHLPVFTKFATVPAGTPDLIEPKEA